MLRHKFQRLATRGPAAYPPRMLRRPDAGLFRMIIARFSSCGLVVAVVAPLAALALAFVVVSLLPQGVPDASDTPASSTANPKIGTSPASLCSRDLFLQGQQGLTARLRADNSNLDISQEVPYILYLDNHEFTDTSAGIVVTIPAAMIDGFDLPSGDPTILSCNLPPENFLRESPSERQWEQLEDGSLSLDINAIPARSSVQLEWQMTVSPAGVNTGRRLSMPISVHIGDKLVYEHVDQPYLIEHPKLQNHGMAVVYRRWARRYGTGESIPQEIIVTNIGNVPLEQVTIEFKSLEDTDSSSGDSIIFDTSSMESSAEWSERAPHDLSAGPWFPAKFDKGTRRFVRPFLNPNDTLTYRWQDQIRDDWPSDVVFTGTTSLDSIVVSHRYGRCNSRAPRIFSRTFDITTAVLTNKPKLRVRADRADGTAAAVVPGERIRYEVHAQCCADSQRSIYHLAFDFPAWIEPLDSTVRYRLAADIESLERNGSLQAQANRYLFQVPDDLIQENEPIILTFDSLFVADAIIRFSRSAKIHVEMLSDATVLATASSSINLAPRRDLELEIKAPGTIEPNQKIDYELFIKQIGSVAFKTIRIGGILPAGFQIIDSSSIDYASNIRIRRYSDAEHERDTADQLISWTSTEKIDSQWLNEGLNLSTRDLAHGGVARIQFSLRAPAERRIGLIDGPKFIVYATDNKDRRYGGEIRRRLAVAHSLTIGQDFLDRFDWKNIIVAEILGASILLVLFQKIRDFVGRLGTFLIIIFLFTGGLVTIIVSSESGTIEWWMALLSISGVILAISLGSLKIARRTWVWLIAFW